MAELPRKEPTDKERSMKKVTVDASKKYDILIERGLLQSAGKYIANIVRPCKCIVLTDDNVAPIYADTLENTLCANGFSPLRITVPHGEDSKSAMRYIEVLEFAAQNALSRTDIFIALGGGVVGDLCGFCAATYLRGVSFVQIPTTLLSMVDSSVGGKTAINIPAGKNLVGAFYQPSLVLCDPDTLDTLSPEVFADGCAEVIKYGIINDKILFEKLKAPIRPQIEDIIENCVSNKRDIVNKDEFDTGIRQLLNLGHTPAHAIEILSDFQISHGSAVAIGTVLMTYASAHMGLCEQSDADEIKRLIASHSLPTDCPFSAEQMAKIANNDKKKSGSSINLVLPYSIGDSRLYKIPVDKLEEIFSYGTGK